MKKPIPQKIILVAGLALLTVFIAADYPELYFDTITLATKITKEIKPKGLTPVAEEFGKIYDNADGIFTSAYIEKLAKYKILLVPGFFGDIYLKKRTLLSLKWNIKKYFHNQKLWLETNNIDYEILNLDTQNFTDENIEIITQAVEKSKKPVIIFAHSKGGLEALDALTRKPSLAVKVKGFIAMQVPFGGTPLADHWLTKAYLMTPTLWYFKITGGNRETIENFTTSVRAKFLSDNGKKIENITKNIPFICIGTWKSKNPFKANSRLWLTRRFLYKLGYERNDGYTPLDYTLASGCEYVFIKNCDHRETVLPDKSNFIDRTKLTKTLLFMVLKRI